MLLSTVITWFRLALLHIWTVSLTYSFWALAGPMGIWSHDDDGRSRLSRRSGGGRLHAYKAYSTHTFDNTSLRLVLPSFSPRGAKRGFTLASSRFSLCVSAPQVRFQVENGVYLVTKYPPNATEHRHRSVVPLLGQLAFFRSFTPVYGGFLTTIGLSEVNSERPNRLTIISPSARPTTSSPKMVSAPWMT